MARNEDSTRRAAFVGAAALFALPLAMPAPAAALPSPDAVLVSFCDEVLAFWSWIDRQAIAEDWDDDVLGAHSDRLTAMLDAVIAASPITASGRAAKARVVAREIDTFHTHKDRTDRLVESLVNDCLRDGGVA